MPVAVVVADSHAVTVAPGHVGDSARLGDVHIPAGPKIAEQAVAGRGHLRAGRKMTALNEINIEPAVAVVIEQSDPPAHRGRRQGASGAVPVLLHELKPHRTRVVFEFWESALDGVAGDGGAWHRG